MDRWSKGAIDYSEVDRWKEALVGRKILNTVSDGEGFSRVLSFVLDDGTVLRAHATDGGCGCANGCFSVKPGNVTRGTIMNVAVKEHQLDYDYYDDNKGAKREIEPGSIQDAKREIEPGSIQDGSSQISVFVYTEMNDEIAERVLVESEGRDNGYYGWGFWFDVVKPGETNG